MERHFLFGVLGCLRIQERNSPFGFGLGFDIHSLLAYIDYAIYIILMKLILC
jgi:hypothetical protein